MTALIEAFAVLSIGVSASFLALVCYAMWRYWRRAWEERDQGTYMSSKWTREGHHGDR